MVKNTPEELQITILCSSNSLDQTVVTDNQVATL